MTLFYLRALFLSLAPCAALAGIACSGASARGGLTSQSEDADAAGVVNAVPQADGSFPGADGGADGASAPPPTEYGPHLVGFDDLASGTDITDQYKQWFTVGSTPGCALQTSNNYDFGQSKPNYALTYFSCAAGATADVTFTFARPVRKITFKGVGINGAKGVALMTLTHPDGSTSSASLDGAGAPLGTTPITVPDTAPVTKLSITKIQDDYGIGFDDLAFEFPE